MRPLRHLCAAFRRWSLRVEQRFAGTAFLVRISLFSALLVCLADPSGVHVEVVGLSRSYPLGMQVPVVHQLTYALHESGHMVVASALRPDGILDFSLVYDRPAKDDGIAAGYTVYLFPPWDDRRAHPDAFWAHLQGGNATEAYFGGTSCKEFVTGARRYFDSDDRMHLAGLASMHGYRYRPGWRHTPQQFGIDPAWPDEIRARARFRAHRALAYGTVAAGHEAIADLAVRHLLKRPRYGMKIVREADLTAVLEAHHIIPASCDPRE